MQHTIDGPLADIFNTPIDSGYLTGEQHIPYRLRKEFIVPVQQYTETHFEHPFFRLPLGGLGADHRELRVFRDRQGQAHAYALTPSAIWPICMNRPQRNLFFNHLVCATLVGKEPDGSLRLQSETWKAGDQGMSRIVRSFNLSKGEIAPPARLILSAMRMGMKPPQAPIKTNTPPRMG